MYISVHEAMPLHSGKYKTVIEVGSMSTKIVEREVLYKANHNGFVVGDWQHVHLWSPLPMTIEDAKKEGLINT